MTTQDWTWLKQDAQHFIDCMDLSKLTKPDFALLGASVAILDHQVDIPTEKIERDAVQVKSYQEIIKEELTDAEMYIKMNETDIAKDELRHAEYFIGKLKGQAKTQDDKLHVQNMWGWLSEVKKKIV